MGKSVIMEKAGKVSEEQVQKALFAGLALFVLLFPLGQYIWTRNSLGSRLQAMFLVSLTLYFCCLFGIERINRRAVIGKGNVAALAGLAMLTISLLSCIRNGKLDTTVYGNDFSKECLLIHVSYYVIFLAASNLTKGKYRRVLLTFLYMMLGFIAVYGIAQFFEVPFFRHSFAKAAVYPARNQNFY
ncbi:MAG: hypothetical protein ACI4QX_05855, partial [Lachnospiraceae bacterium]